MNIRLLEGAQDTERLRAGFKEVFGADISPAMLHWKYGEGRGRSWGAFAQDGSLLAHCGVVYRDVLAEGEPRRIGQLCDLLATSARSDGLSRRQSAFFRLLDAVLDSAPDAHVNPDALCFGFPSERAMRLSVRLGLCVYIDQVHELALPALAPRRVAWWAVHSALVGSPTFDRKADALWARMARDLGADIVGVRDAAYLRHRYVAHPSHHYALYWVGPRWGAPAACAVVRAQGDTFELMDVVAPVAYMAPAIEALQRQLPAMGGRLLKIWLTKGQMRHLPEAMAADAVPLQFRIMANPRSSGGNGMRFAGRWWLTSGDTDYR